jgi:hypothetical protein
VDCEAAAPSRFALHRDRAALGRDDASANGKAQPDPSAAEPADRLCAIERLEDVRKITGRDAAATVLNRQGDRAWLAPRVLEMKSYSSPQTLG